MNKVTKMLSWRQFVTSVVIHYSNFQHTVTFAAGFSAHKSHPHSIRILARKHLHMRCVPQKCVCHCHIKRSIGRRGLANPSFDMTPTTDFSPAAFTQMDGQTDATKCIISPAFRSVIIGVIPKEGLA